MNGGRYFLTNDMPFCKGCGHSQVARSVQNALESIPGLNPLDVILVSDIGCIGIIDKAFATHTIHGLHGRSAALAAGVTLGLENPRKKVLVFLGDGGATIGLQHLLEGAQRNLDMKVIVHNNMLYGMTGGQPSGLSPKGFKTSILPEGQTSSGFDLCRLFHCVGAPYSQRLIAVGDFSADLVRAFSTKGFAFVEAIELCPSIGVKFNPDRKPADIAKENGLEPVILTNPDRPIFAFAKRNPADRSLLNELSVIDARFPTLIKKSWGVILSGSAGEGVQSAAEFLAETGMSCGLHVTKKGLYPVTVGVGFSTAEICLSPNQINYTGGENPDALVVTSLDGWKKVKARIEKLSEKSLLIIDSSVQEIPETKAKIISIDLRGPMGGRNSSVYALLYLLHRVSLVPVEAFTEKIARSKLGKKLDVRKMSELAAK